MTKKSGDQDMIAGQVGPVPHERHGLEALEDSAVLLTAVTEVRATSR